MTQEYYISRNDVMAILNKHLNNISYGNNAKIEFTLMYEEIEILVPSIMEVV